MTEKIESSETEDETIIVPGRDKPKDIPGRQWFPVRNNPLKPQQRTAWRLGPKPDPDAEFSWPPAKPPEVQSRRRKDDQRKDDQLKAGVGTFVSRTAAAMDKAKERAEEVGEEAAKRRAKDSSPDSNEIPES